MENCYLKKATEQDMRMIFDWANDEQVRKNSFNTNEITWEEHKRWFMEKLSSTDCEIFIMYFGDIPVGQIRLNYSGNSAYISYSISAEYRGQGYGRKLLYLAEEKVRKEHGDIEVLEAEVKADNIASQKKFEQLGYDSTELVRYKKFLD